MFLVSDLLRRDIQMLELCGVKVGWPPALLLPQLAVEPGARRRTVHVRPLLEPGLTSSSASHLVEAAVVGAGVAVLVTSQNRFVLLSGHTHPFNTPITLHALDPHEQDEDKDDEYEDDGEQDHDHHHLEAGERLQSVRFVLFTARPSGVLHEQLGLVDDDTGAGGRVTGEAGPTGGGSARAAAGTRGLVPHSPRVKAGLLAQDVTALKNQIFIVH